MSALFALMIGLLTSLGLVLVHNSLLVPSLTNLHNCPRLLQRYSEHGLPSLPHSSHLLPPVGATHGLQVRLTVSSLVLARRTSNKL